MMAYFLEEARHSEWTQRQLASFAGQVEFTLQQTILQLHETWPARRTRWWAILAHAALSIRSIIPQMPYLRFAPSAIHVLRSMLDVTAQQLEQLALTKYELRQFYAARGGIAASILDLYKAMPTANGYTFLGISSCWMFMQM